MNIEILPNHCIKLADINYNRMKKVPTKLWCLGLIIYGKLNELMLERCFAGPTSQQHDEKRRLLSHTVTQGGVCKHQLPQHAYAGLQQAIHALHNE